VNTDERLIRFLQATPEQVDAIDAVLMGKPISEERSLRLFRTGEAAEKTGLSRTTLWRAIRDGNLKAVEVRKGSLRIAESELRRFVEGR